MIAGLSGLMGIQLLLFILAVIIWIGLVDVGGWLLLGTQAVSVISLVVIIWMWLVPMPSKFLDTAALVLLFLTITLVFLGGGLWVNPSTPETLTNFQLAQIYAIMGVVILAIGLFLLIQRKPRGWEFGTAMIAILITGYLAQVLLSGRYGIANTEIIRLSTMAAYPLLLALPQRFLQNETREDDASADINLDTFNSLYNRMGAESKASLSGRILVAGLVEQFKAAMCMLVEMPDDFSLVVRNILDTRKGKLDIPTNLDPDLSPLLVRSLRLDRGLRLPASSSASEMNVLAQVLGLELTGHMMVVPIRNFGYPVMGLLMVRSPSDPMWVAGDVKAVRSLSGPLVHFLQLTDHMSFIQGQLENSERKIKELQSTSRGAGLDSPELNTEMQMLLLDGQEKQSQLQTLADMVSLQQEQLAAAAQEISSLTMQVSTQRGAFNQQAAKEVMLQLDELRQPVVSIEDHTGFLLGESMGSLDAMQRNFIERIRNSSERALQIIEDLENSLDQTISGEASQFSLADLGEIIDASINNTMFQLRNKQIVLRMDIPEEVPELLTNQVILQEAVSQVLAYAGAVSPVKGEVILRALVEQDGGRMEYIIIQVTDSGPGLPQSTLESIFTAGSGSAFTGVYDLENGDIDLAHVSDLVTRLRGRIWIDNEPQKGSTISMLLPVLPSIIDESEGYLGTV